VLSPLNIPGCFVTGAHMGAGVASVSGAIADWFRRNGARVGVCVPAATGVKRRREGLVSEEAEFLAKCADSRFPLDLICPQRFAEDLEPAIAARRAGVSLDWDAIARSIRIISSDSDVMIVAGPRGGAMVPLDERYLTIDLALMLKIPAIVVAQAGRGSINQTLLTLNALRGASVRVAGIVINRYPTDTPSTEVETSLREIEKRAGVPLLCIIPNEPAPSGELSTGAVAAVNLVDWRAKIIAQK
jgi:dethiobiotin synthetase